MQSKDYRHILKFVGRRSFLLYFLLASFSSSVFAQSNDQVGNWSMLFSQIRFHDKWSTHTDIQYRSYEIKPNAEQLLLRAGINYHMSNNSLATIGYAYIINYAFDKELMPGSQATENRLWQQFIMRNAIGRIAFEHRYRLEQRWISSNSTERYLDRIRYFLRITIPLNNKEMKKNTIFFSGYNELFIHLNSMPFDRNRLYGAVGYQFTSTSNFQLGYLAQTVNTTTRHFLQAGLFYNIDLRKKG